MVKIGIVGSRRRDSEIDFDIVEKSLLSLIRDENGFLDDEVCLVSGGCPKGADRFAEELSKKRGIPIIIHYPDKSKFNKILAITNPRMAYAEIAFARNKKIAEDSDYLIACVSEDRKGGTESTIKYFLETHSKDRLILV